MKSRPAEKFIYESWVCSLWLQINSFILAEHNALCRSTVPNCKGMPKTVGLNSWYFDIKDSNQTSKPNNAGQFCL